jgi:hypothetical protein
MKRDSIRDFRPLHGLRVRVLLRVCRRRIATRIGFAITTLLLFLTAPAHAGLVTFQFSGLITDSNSSMVNVGEPFSGTFTYDTDAPNQAPPSPLPGPLTFGLYDFDLPQAFPIGMTFHVGPLAYATKSLLEVLVTNDDPLLADSLSVSSDDQVGGLIPPHVDGQVFLADFSGSALTSIEPPPALNLAALADIQSFSGDDGTRGGSFDGTILSLSSVPEPGSLMLLAFGALVVLARIGCLGGHARKQPPGCGERTEGSTSGS